MRRARRSDPCSRRQYKPRRGFGPQRRWASACGRQPAPDAQRYAPWTATDLTGSFRAKAHRIEPAVSDRLFLNIGQHAAGVDANRVVPSRSAQIDMSWDSPLLSFVVPSKLRREMRRTTTVLVNSFEHLTRNSISVHPGSNPGSLGDLDAAADKQERISQRTLALNRSTPSAAVRPKRAVGGSLVGTKKEEKQNFRVQFLHTTSHK